MRYTQELADRAAAYQARPLVDKRSAEGLLELAIIWAAIHNLPPVECRQCQYSERYADVAAYAREFSRLQLSPDAMSETTPSKYQIAPAFAGQTFVHEDLSAPVTAENLTDELAEFFISKGRDDAFIKKSANSTVEAAGEDADNDGADKSARDFEAELTAEQKAHGTTSTKLQKEQDAHTKASESLKSEKEAHKATKKELSEVQKQLADAQKQLTALAEKAQEAAGEQGATDAAADASK